MLEVMHINYDFSTKDKAFKKGELYLCLAPMKRVFIDALNRFAIERNNPKIRNSVSFYPIESIFKKANKDIDFKTLLIIRYGGIGDLIALSSIIDYFDDKNIVFMTQKRYFPIFDWFVKKPKYIDVQEAFIKDFKLSDITFKYDKWARFQGEGIIENGHNRNWFELFFSFVDENNPDIDFLRPQLNCDRIANYDSNISKINSNRQSLLICNKATAMMRTIYISDILTSLPDQIKEKYDIFVYESNIAPNEKMPAYVNVIGKTDLATFFLDCYDADNVVSVDTGALHFREGINKPAIGLYNSFTTDARTKYYQYTKSFDLKSDCELQPCFLHERPNIKHCIKGNKNSFAAPCIDSKFNTKLIGQLKEIFKNNL